MVNVSRCRYTDVAADRDRDRDIDVRMQLRDTYTLRYVACGSVTGEWGRRLCIAVPVTSELEPGGLGPYGGVVCCGARSSSEA